MPFTDHFKESDKQKALQYRKEWGVNLELATEYHNKGEFDKAEMHLAHAMRLLGEIRIMNLQHQNHEKMLSDHAMQTRYNW
ncbi:hypothetical protein ACTNEO_05195 [Gracilibacillus sp. HCP3S3_G5_1]|uniref:hypothetical protein n=1 Tax=unclassified Gracilibacillus TaxID=2625209 RepID=UPI003F8C60CF